MHGLRLRLEIRNGLSLNWYYWGCLLLMMGAAEMVRAGPGEVLHEKKAIASKNDYTKTILLPRFKWKSHNFSRSTLSRFFGKECRLSPMAEKMLIEHLPKIKEKTVEQINKNYFRPLEVSLSKRSYVQRMLGDKVRLRAGLQFMRKNENLLKKAERKYGVPGSYVAAIIGIESNYGQSQGRYRVFDALSFLGFSNKVVTKKPKAAKYFRSELCALTNDLAKRKDKGKASNDLSSEQMKGSYAGAMGMIQFMPSSYLNYAADGDGDKRVDIWRSRGDAIFSVANYLRQHGWSDENPEMAIWQYNQSDSYVEAVVELARQLQAGLGSRLAVRLSPGMTHSSSVSLATPTVAENSADENP